MMKAEITSIVQATPKIKVFRLFHGKHDYAFKPGQWIDLKAPVEGKNIGGYTIISSAHTQESIDLAVRESLHHPVTIFLHSAAVGTAVEITEGQGKFFLTDDIARSGRLVFIAGGIGLTPILSMIRSVDRTQTKVQLFYSVSRAEDLLFKEELQPFSVFTVTKDQSWSGEKSRISVDLLKKYQTDFESHFFICGPKAMIDAMVVSLKEAGVSPERIHFEKWW